MKKAFQERSRIAGLSVSCLLLALTIPRTLIAERRFVEPHLLDTVNSNSVMVAFEVFGETPELMAVVVQAGGIFENQDRRAKHWAQEIKTNSYAKPQLPSLLSHPQQPFENAKWISFRTNLLVDLGPGDGERTVLFSYRYKGQARSDGWSASSVTVRTSKPVLCIVNPTNMILAQPLVQLQGYASQPLQSVRYDLINSSGMKVSTDQEGFVRGSYEGGFPFKPDEEYFTCLDIELSPGTNTIVIRAEDTAGNLITTNFVYIFSTEGVTSGPSLYQHWPQNNTCISGTEFTIDGKTDDPSAKIIALIVNPAGEFSTREALVERDGKYWVEYLPLLEGRTYVTLVARNASGFTTITNISVRKSHYTLTMDPVPSSKLWNQTVTVTGTASLMFTNYVITVNGAKAILDSSGHWRADKVPVTEGGTASFLVNAMPKSGHDECDEPDPYPTVPIVWGEATNQIKSGIYIAPGDTNHFNRYRCDFYLVNASRTNMSYLWMRPKGRLICSLTLYDKDGKEVPRSFMGKEKARPLAVNLDTHHLDSEAIELVDGVLPLASNAPVCVSSINLIDQFTIGSPGDYHVEIRGRLYRITDTGKLAPFELAPLLIPVTVTDQPSEMVFHLRYLERAGQLACGKPMNFLRVCVAHNINPQRGSRGNDVAVFLENSGTNEFRNLRLPAPREQFDISLYDSSGNEVPKTPLGQLQGKPLSNDLKGSRRMRWVMIAPKDATDCLIINLNDYFEIKTPGKYRLTYQQRLYQIGADGIPKGMTLPMVIAPIEIR